jgi:hypothetical protein
MTPKEVHGLQALAKASGGSLSINPDTGLVEAGFLSKILPVVAAAAATYFTAGAAAPALAAAMGGGAAATAGAGILAGAGSGALINGGMAAIQGKDVGEAALSGGLGGAISGGLGAYSGAPDLTNGAFMPSGTPPVGTVPVTTPSVPSIDVNAGVSQGVTGSIPPSVPTPPPVTAAPGPEIPNYTDAMKYKPMTETEISNAIGQPKISYGYPNAIGGETYNVNNKVAQGLMDEATLASKPGLLSGNYYQGLGSGGIDTAQKLGIQALPVMSQLEDQQNLVPTAEDPSKLKRISADFRAQDPVRPNPYYKARYAAGGGLMDLRPQTNFANPSSYSQGTSQYSIATDPMSGNIAERMASGGNTTKKQRATLTSDRSLAAMDPYEAGLANLNNARYGANMAGIKNPSAMTRLGEIPTAAGGGLSHLGGYSDGGRMLKGPGDGMSDNIPATIGSKQPARLADGEFVVPADVVSHLGNGSTDAGAKKLYAMMDKVRRARTGKKAQGKQINPNRFLPA